MVWSSMAGSGSCRCRRRSSQSAMGENMMRAMIQVPRTVAMTMAMGKPLRAAVVVMVVMGRHARESLPTWRSLRLQNILDVTARATESAGCHDNIFTPSFEDLRARSSALGSLTFSRMGGAGRTVAVDAL